MQTNRRRKPKTGTGKGRRADGTSVKPAKAGMGRPKGVPNKITSTIREAFSAFVTANVPQMQLLFDKVAKHDPARALLLISQFADYCIPRLQRTELQLPPDVALRTDPITNAEQAAQVYMTIIGNPSLDIGALQFAPEPIAIQQARPTVVVDTGPDATPGPTG